MKLYLDLYGHQVLNNGYEPIPITPKKKFPNFDDWRDLPKITHKQVNRWLSNGHAKDGLGIRTKFTPFLDLDCKNEELRDAVLEFVEERFGLGPIRVGNAPKMGMVYRTEEPFTKVQSSAYIDPDGNKAQVEFLGDGQQFVAYGIHPDTKKPYRWTEKGENPIRIPAEDLPLITKEDAQAIKDFFDEWCVSHGWKRFQKKSKAVAVVKPQGDEIWDGIDTSRCGLSIEEVRQWVERLPNDETVEYEDEFGGTINYRNVIFAIWHETEGSEEGKEIAWEWSEKSTKHETELGRFGKLWGSADPEDREGVITFRYIIKLVKDLEDEEKKELRDGYLDSLSKVDDVDDLKTLIETIKKTKFDNIDTGQIAGSLAKAYKRLVGSPLTVTQARKLITHKPTEDEIPSWAKPWVYILHTNHFYNTETGLELDHKAFDARYTRYLDGYPAPKYALDVLQINTYWMTMYKPDAPKDFEFEGHPCINTFSDRLMPEMPESFSRGDRKAIRLLRAHLKNILPSARERGLLLSFLAYIVQTRQRPNWGIVLQGVDGDGKSFLGELMGAVLGGTKNVRKLDPQQLEDKYTGWAVGQLLTVIEEIRLHGHSRYDILNKVKPFVTNNAINVHPKNVNPYTALNTTAYIALTNFKDALPLTDNDRRWMILMSRWQHGEALRDFLNSHPGYFEALFNAIDEHAGAFRKYLSEYEFREEFNAKSRAPLTKAREEMIELAKSDVQKLIEDMIEDDTYPRVGPDLIVSGVLMAELAEMTTERVSRRGIGTLLSSLGYAKIPHRIRLDPDQTTMDTIWVKNIQRFNRQHPFEVKNLVSRFLRKRQKQLNHGE